MRPDERYHEAKVIQRVVAELIEMAEDTRDLRIDRELRSRAAELERENADLLSLVVR